MSRPAGTAQRVGRLLIILGLATVSCASAPRAPETSCIQRSVDSLNLAGLSGDRKHCLASGTIAARCGVTSAWAAGYGKELADLVGPGSFQRRDLEANSAGRRCASALGGEQSLAACCAAGGF